MGRLVSLATDEPMLAIDPGVSTGMAYRMPDGSYETVVLGQWDEEEVWSSITPNLGTVIYENFRCKVISKYGLYTVRMIGGIIALCKAYKIPCIRQEPPERRIFVPVAQQYLRKHKQDSFVIHEADALAHMFAFNNKNGGLSPELRQAIRTVPKRPAFKGLG